MDQRRLEAFVALAQELNFTRAAHRLNMTQSTLSAAMKALESELDVVLFDRSTRSVMLTQSGRALLPYARKAIDAIDAVRGAAHPSGGLRGSLTVGMLSGLRLVDVPALAGDFHRRYPSVQLRLQTSRRGTGELIERIKEGSVDAAFVGTNINDPQLRVTPIRSYLLHLVTPANHPLSGRQNVTLAEISREPFVDMPFGFGQRAVIDDAFAQHSLSRPVLVEVADLTTVPEYVAHGLGVALLPPELVLSSKHDLSIVPIAGADISWTLSVIVKAAHPASSTVDAFLDLIPRHTRGELPF
ncbi:DNA-binding transcriptional LysR family regulator [Ochrobactrum daejeonense]|jgi:DNA-binding transcriptional LysR family regulator|uniref:DNA-binding transcriptional LysR family regulator n=1 Tax=Brucella daejeonensis TaxID=659015 RepID=A0A7W9ENM3_9HYPH|nr:LysR family transcriptional regulator [Brucella daejeonensis]MBB5704637.1 DNA-binding transcriptional LysR family regulator [Brucella daejeonensis]